MGHLHDDLITRIPRSHRYRLTDTLHHAMLISHVHTRLLSPRHPPHHRVRGRASPAALGFGIDVDGARIAELRDKKVQLVGMSPWTGISVGVDARGPVSWELRERRGPFRYTDHLRAVTYTPGRIRVPTGTIEAVEREAEFIAE